MSPSEHYQIADKIMQELREDSHTERQLPLSEQDRHIARAQVHALLAQYR